MKLKELTSLFIGFMISASICGCIVGDSGKDDERTIVLYGFSVKGEVMEDRIIPAFKEHWKEYKGEDVSFVTSYAGSGRITSQVINGAEVEVMVLSTEWDAIELKRSGKITTDWKTFPHNGTITTSPWIIMTRNGNPDQIDDFVDLTGDVDLIHADPITSGGARWSVFSVYGSAIRNVDIQEDCRLDHAEDLLGGIVDNVIGWQSSARQALSQFILGYGDAFITYENDALLCMDRGEDVDIVYPHSTILSEHKVVMVDSNVCTEEKDLIEEFIDFLYTEEVQSYFVEYHFRSVIEDLNSVYPIVEDPFTIGYLGGWETAMEELIDGVYRDIREG